MERWAIRMNAEQMWYELIVSFGCGSFRSNQINYVIKLGNLTCWKMEFHVDVNILSNWLTYMCGCSSIRTSTNTNDDVVCFSFVSISKSKLFAPVRFFFLYFSLFTRNVSVLSTFTEWSVWIWFVWFWFYSFVCLLYSFDSFEVIFL